MIEDLICEPHPPIVTLIEQLQCQQVEWTLALHIAQDYAKQNDINEQLGRIDDSIPDYFHNFQISEWGGTVSTWKCDNQMIHEW